MQTLGLKEMVQIGFYSCKAFANSLRYFTVLPGRWIVQGTHYVIGNTGQQQIIPAEVPLKLVALIYRLNHLRGPGKTMLYWSLSNLQAGYRPELTCYCQ